MSHQELHEIADIIWDRLLIHLAHQTTQTPQAGPQKQHTFIAEKDAARMFGYEKHPRTLRERVLGRGNYSGKERLPIAFTQAGKSYRYSLQDIERYIRRTSSR